MARKGQKFNKYSDELKQMVLNDYFENHINVSSLGRRYKIPRESIKNWISKTKHCIDAKTDHRGRPKSKNLTLEDYKERYEILKKYQAFLQARREKK